MKMKKKLSLAVFKYKIMKEKEIYDNIASVIDLFEINEPQIKIPFVKTVCTLFSIIILPYIMAKYQNEISRNNRYLYMLVVLIVCIAIIFEFFQQIIDIKKTRRMDIIRYLKLVKFEKTLKI